MKWLLLILGVLVGLLALVALIGALLPKGHVATRAARFRQPPEAIWQALTDIEAMSSWRTDLKSVKRLPDRNGLPAWLEVSKFGEMPLEVVEWVPPRRLVARIADPKLSFGGTWTYEIASLDGESALRITENGEIYNPIFRFLSRFVFGHTATLEQYLKAFGRKFGQDVRLEP